VTLPAQFGAHSPRQHMFSFLKRFRGSKASDSPADTSADAPAQAEAATPEAPLAEAPRVAAPATQQRPAEQGQRPAAPAAPAAQTQTQVSAPSSNAAAAAQPAVPAQTLTPPAVPAPGAVPTQAASPAPVSSTAPAPSQSAASAATSSTAAQDAASRAGLRAAPQPQSAPVVAAAADPEETVEIIPPPAPEPAARRSWLSRLKTGLSKTGSSITGIFVNTKIDDDLYEELETALLMSDAGVDATEFLLESLRETVRVQRLTDPQQVKTALRDLLVGLLKPLEKSLMLGRDQPLVMMIAGVNGAGKTTSIGKLAKHLQRFDQSVLLAAGDTFRAAAREQLAIWGERNNVTVVSQESGDPAAVIFDAVGAARARKIDVLMADTAGRLPTQLHLMEELRKVKRVIGKALEGAPHEVLLVIDANTGQNALAQVKAFDDALGLTGLIVTKLDGTAKGGILAAIARQRPVPVYFIGVGEKVEDLQPFSAEEFCDALLGN
jgi:fused signal recognition particle receptor